MTLYISPDGSDKNDGTIAHPLASLIGARDMIRSLRTQHKKTDYCVLLRDGIYRITQTVVFGIEDDCSEGESVTYAAYPGEHPILSAAVPVTGWRKLASDEEPSHLCDTARGKVWTAELPSVDGRTIVPRALFAGDRMLPRARGHRFSPVPDPPSFDEEVRRTTIRIEPGTVEAWPDLGEAEVLVIPKHSWTMNHLPVSELRDDGREIVTSVPHTYPMTASAPTNGPMPRAGVWVENTLAVLSEPGEWVAHAGNGRLYYMPAGDTPEEDIAAPTLTELVRVEGTVDYDGPRDTPVRGIRFEGLSFRHGDRYPWHGKTGWGLQHDWEAFDKPTALIRFRGAESCSVSRCEVGATAGAAIRCDLHCSDISILGNHIHDTGGVGVLLAGYGPGTKDANCRNEIVDNRIHHVGRVTWHAPAVFVWQSGRNLIAHNLIHHTPYTAVVVSGRMRWDRRGELECSRTVRRHETSTVVGKTYEQQPWYDAWYPDWKRREPLYHSRQNVFEYNEIHHVMETMGDGNGVYISGAGGGNIVRYNCIHDCPSDFMYEAIRCDDDQHGTTIHGNLIFGLGGAAIGIANKGINHITNNIIAAPLPDATKRGMISLEMDRLYGSEVKRNIIYATKPKHDFVYEGRPIHGDGRDTCLADCNADCNLYWSTEDEARGAVFIREKQKHGIELNSASADPLFVDPSAGDFRLRPDSPAYALGFEPIDLDSVGPRN